MASFSVKGPFDVPVERMAVGRMIGAVQAKQFWSNNPEISDGVGCYIFAFRAAKGLKPMYIGKATKSFKSEVFKDHKLNKYSVALASQKKGTPVFFFVCLKKTKGRINKTAIDEVESYLIQAGLIANKKILNDRKTAVESWSIGGIVRSGRGKASGAAKDLIQCLNL